MEIMIATIPGAHTTPVLLVGTKTGYGTTPVWCRGGSRYVEGYWGPGTPCLNFSDLEMHQDSTIAKFRFSKNEKPIVLDPRKFNIIEAPSICLQK